MNYSFLIIFYDNVFMTTSLHLISTWIIYSPYKYIPRNEWLRTGSLKIQIAAQGQADQLGSFF